MYKKTIRHRSILGTHRGAHFQNATLQLNAVKINNDRHIFGPIKY